MLSALAVALVIAGATLALRGRAEEGTVAALRLTARWSYLWFWSAYTALRVTAVVRGSLRRKPA